MSTFRGNWILSVLPLALTSQFCILLPIKFMTCLGLLATLQGDSAACYRHGTEGVLLGETLNQVITHMGI